jgi:DNA-binding GntR family transcriptional regulator
LDTPKRVATLSRKEADIDEIRTDREPSALGDKHLSHDDTFYDGKESEVVRALEEDIIFGLLAPGTRLVEDVLMQRFGMTRHLVRRALFQLERMGIVTQTRNKGSSVRLLSPTEVIQIYDVRELLQRQAALKIPLPAPHRLLDELERINAVYARGIGENDLRALHESNDQFHLTMFRACGNDYLVDTIVRYMRLTLPVRAKSFAYRETLLPSERQHRLMIEMMRGTDNWSLAQLCTDHIQPSKETYLAQVKSGGDDEEKKYQRQKVGMLF